MSIEQSHVRREAAGEVAVEVFAGDRSVLRPLFELAEDSRPVLDGYLEDGQVLVARIGGDVVGHLQLVSTRTDSEVEIKNMAVQEDLQGRGIGCALVRAALLVARSEGRTSVVVATAAADVGNLRFYQRQGFRLRSVEHDAFCPATGYPRGLFIDGVELRDRVWLDQPVGAAADGS
jgi:predicted N-acetyltransferase YhbS